MHATVGGRRRGRTHTPGREGTSTGAACAATWSSGRGTVGSVCRAKPLACADQHLNVSSSHDTTTQDKTHDTHMTTITHQTRSIAQLGEAVRQRKEKTLVLEGSGIVVQPDKDLGPSHPLHGVTCVRWCDDVVGVGSHRPKVRRVRLLWRLERGRVCVWGGGYGWRAR
jgi:hypothetical protein